ncbi:Flp pilus assembly protein TadD [Chromobacterium alkanivorans]|uniref:tetratricopeptide repeat-containing glycosyltransferase family protein n=1 Tax=Chromobacterium alkanivorans TaxID=1071719 RepID=UPI00216A725F|nr:tetratricopeptide repeat-containing glycosyltransferase family protein [Chromobacterium alkanivorans]MCS3805192.1 Flp pilus assembly protein TadD [Chromobacterium alkanivorans]MCS3819245.1 Flp pilus assembly protein TadD [Chromobacterium alkanivorans]MCS3873757.1 Flp pilus assembly protein TadD [Chromobacterium alkanivorans]
MADQAFERGNQLAAQGRWREAEQAFDQCLRQNAGDWQALANRANARLRQGDSARALDDYLAAAALNPQSVNIKCNLAVLLKELGELELAEALLREALAAEPEHVDAWSNLGVVLQHRLQYQEAIACHLRAIELAGASPARCNNLGYACTCALLLDDAVAVLQGGLELDPNDANLRFSLSIALLLAGRYAEAWPYYEARWEAILQPRHRERRWQGQALDASTLLLWAEQGLGDSLQMARFLPRLRAEHPRARLLLACPKTFHRLFAQFDGIELLEPDAAPAFDWQLPLMSLPGVLGVTLDNLPGRPYLSAVPAAEVPPRAGGRPRVGVVWESGQWGVGKADHWRRHKSLPLEDFAALCRLPGIDFVSLQPGETPAALQGLLAAPVLSDFADTAAWVAELDLVITVDTAVAHLAGAMGKPVWVLMRAESAPFFLTAGERAPWYESMRVWRQAEPGVWAPVLEGAAQALAQRFAAAL